MLGETYLTKFTMVFFKAFICLVRLSNLYLNREFEILIKNEWSELHAWRVLSAAESDSASLLA